MRGGCRGRALRAAAEQHLGGRRTIIQHKEVYSCFPSAVRVQQRELGLAVDGTPTVTGGMAFAGGPFNSFVLHATVEIARRIRAQGGRGLVTTVSGLLTKPGLAVWGAVPGDGPALVADLTQEVAAATEQVEGVGMMRGALEDLAVEALRFTEVAGLVMAQRRAEDIGDKHG